MFLVVVPVFRVPGVRPDRHPDRRAGPAGSTETLVFKIFNARSP